MLILQDRWFLLDTVRWGDGVSKRFHLSTAPVWSCPQIRDINIPRWKIQLGDRVRNAPPSDGCAQSGVHRSADAVEVKVEREFTRV